MIEREARFFIFNYDLDCNHVIVFLSMWHKNTKAICVLTFGELPSQSVGLHVSAGLLSLSQLLRCQLDQFNVTLPVFLTSVKQKSYTGVLKIVQSFLGNLRINFERYCLLIMKSFGPTVDCYWFPQLFTPGGHLKVSSIVSLQFGFGHKWDISHLDPNGGEVGGHI